jgi:hypothetical protein
MSCKPVDIPNVMPGWGCCKCRAYNGNQRDNCKICEHPRCDSPAVKKIPIFEKDGMKIVTINMNPLIPTFKKDIN